MCQPVFRISDGRGYFDTLYTSEATAIRVAQKIDDGQVDRFLSSGNWSEKQVVYPARGETYGAFA